MGGRGGAGEVGDVVSLHSFRAGGLQVISAQYWVDQMGMVVATTGSNRAVGILTG